MILTVKLHIIILIYTPSSKGIVCALPNVDVDVCNIIVQSTFPIIKFWRVKTFDNLYHEVSKENSDFIVYSQNGKPNEFKIFL